MYYYCNYIQFELETFAVSRFCCKSCLGLSEINHSQSFRVFPIVTLHLNCFTSPRGPCSVVSVFRRYAKASQVPSMHFVAAIFVVVKCEEICLRTGPQNKSASFFFASVLNFYFRRLCGMAQYKGAASEAGRAMQLMKKREKEREQLEQLKQKIAEDNMVKSNIDKKFSAHYDAVEAELKSSTVGLVTLNDMKAKQEALVKEREKQLAKKEQSKELMLKLEKQKEKKRKEEQKRKIASLSFNPEDEGEEEEETEDEDQDYLPAKKKLGKNPDVDTSFLPDRDREEEENRLREELRQEWELKQEKIKSEEIEITFSYWDGSGHRHHFLLCCSMKKGNTIQNFLQRALEVLRKDFSELRSAGVEQLMYIKEDLIIPHHHSFYDFIVTKARGKSGPLFSFDVHDDIRLVNDATVEKDESHAGKVVLRSWYEKNKHIFPASRWEPYDPEKKWDKYTFCGAARKPLGAGLMPRSIVHSELGAQNSGLSFHYNLGNLE
uniref:Family with sequence similarity 50 member A n=1 Tax=Scophthalmus maximus TaxID=52904 RepID=A0A8D2ZUB9_SCOMX